MNKLGIFWVPRILNSVDFKEYLLSYNRIRPKYLNIPYIVATVESIFCIGIDSTSRYCFDFPCDLIIENIYIN